MAGLLFKGLVLRAPLRRPARSTEISMPRLLPAVLATSALIATAAVAPASAAPPAPAPAAGTGAVVTTLAAADSPGRTVTLVGNLQDELGCDVDWAPQCTATQLDLVDPEGTAYTGVFEVPAGSWEFKFALNGTWDESYPGANVPLVLEGPATIQFGYDDRSEEHTSELQSRENLVCRLLLE